MRKRDKIFVGGFTVGILAGGQRGRFAALVAVRIFGG